MWFGFRCVKFVGTAVVKFQKAVDVVRRKKGACGCNFDAGVRVGGP